jgi:hypothetical protein
LSGSAEEFRPKVVTNRFSGIFQEGVAIMKPVIVAGAVLLAVGAAQAFACSAPTGAMNTSDVGTTLETGGRIACAGSPGNWENQEIHLTGTLSDYKKGASDPTDPTSPIGSYSITDDGHTFGIVSYTYSAGGSFAFYLVPESGTTAGAAGTYDFYSGADGLSGVCVTSIPVKVETTAGSGCA